MVVDLLDLTGIARCGDLSGCRWVAVRYAADHVHVAAMVMRQATDRTGRRVSGGRSEPVANAARSRRFHGS